MIQERRKFQRSSTFLIANFRDLKSLQQNSSGITADFSREGIGIESHSIYFQRGETLEILLKDPQSELSFSAEGEIVWKKDGWYNCKAGVKFKKIAPLSINKILALISGADKHPAESQLPGNGSRKSDGGDKKIKADSAAPITSKESTGKAGNIDETIYTGALESTITDKEIAMIDALMLNGVVTKDSPGEKIKSHVNNDSVPASDRIIGTKNKKHLSIVLLMLLSAVFLAAASLTSGNIKRFLGFNIRTDQLVASQDAVKEKDVSFVDSGRANVLGAQKPPESVQVPDNQNINDASLTGQDKSHVQQLSAVAETGKTNDTVTIVTTHDNNQNKNLSSSSDMLPVNDIRATIMFDYNSDIIDPMFYTQIGDIIKALLANPKSIVKIKGHADNTGPEMYNLDLSMRRSLSVKKILLQKGIDNERIKLAFLGESNPAASNRTESGRMRNRRVEMLVVAAAD